MKNNVTSEQIKSFRLPAYDEIPEVGLYLEQVATYISTYLEPLEGITLTTSMISNYVKQGLIASPEKKLYGRDQIAYLIFIAVAKSVLSLNQVASLISLQKKAYNEQTAYDYFCMQFKNVLDYVFGFKEELSDVGVEVSGEKTMLRNTIITVAHKVYLDYCFNVVYKKL